MSYRAFKRLLGETSLERKCRCLLGAGVLLLMTGSFWAYARQTEDLAYGQLETTGRALLAPIVYRLHVKGEQFQAIKAFEELSEASRSQAALNRTGSPSCTYPSRSASSIIAPPPSTAASCS